MVEQRAPPYYSARQSVSKWVHNCAGAGEIGLNVHVMLDLVSNSDVDTILLNFVVDTIARFVLLELV